MWRTRHNSVEAFASLGFLALSLGACFTILLFSWPEKAERPGLPNVHASVALSSPISPDAEIVRATLQTGSISISRRSDVTY
jgi:hypothetical protein